MLDLWSLNHKCRSRRSEFPFPWDRGDSGTRGRTRQSGARATRRREVEERLKKDRSPSNDGVGDDSPRSPWDTSNNTLLAHDSLHPGTEPSLDPRDPPSPRGRSFLAAFRAFTRRSVDAHENVFHVLFSSFSLVATVSVAQREAGSQVSLVHVTVDLTCPSPLSVCDVFMRQMNLTKLQFRRILRF